MAAIPFRIGVANAPAREDAMPTEGCGRCGISEAAACNELRTNRRKGLQPFQRVHNEQDVSMHVCYLCQREWEVFWQCFRPNVPAFHLATPFKPTASAVPYRWCCAQGSAEPEADPQRRAALDAADPVSVI